MQQTSTSDVDTSALAAEDLIERACKLAVTTPPREQADFLVDAIGARMVTAAVGLRDARAVRAWARGGDIKEAAAEQRLQELFQVVWAISERYSPAVAAAFVRGSNPYLGDRAPLVVLADEPPEKAGPAILAAARHLLED